MKVLKFLAALLLLAPLSQSAWADLCIDPTTGGWATCSASATGPLGSPGAIGNGTPSTGAFTTLSVTGQLTSTLANGTPPFVVASSTNVPNLNASTLSGKTHADPGPIGSGTPSTGAFTTLSSSSGMALSSLATQATNTVLANVTSGTAVPTATAVSTCSTAGSALKWTTNTGFGCNTAIDAATSTAVTDASAATAGKVGEVASINCVVGAAAAAATTVLMPLASPGVVTWSSHTFAISTGLANYTCPINFLAGAGALPTGITAGTTYWIIGSTVSGDTFQVSDTAAHALAGTNAVNFTVSTTPGMTAYIGNVGANGTAFAGAALSLVAGDWECSALGEFQELTALTESAWKTGISTSSTAFGAIGTFTQVTMVSGASGANSYYQPSPVVHENISATTTVANIVASTFSGGTMNEGGFLQCWRIR